MIDPPKRTGYCLTYDAELLYDNWRDIGGCSCHTGCTPCSSCYNDGHPISLEENDEAWELDEEVENMARNNIIDKRGTQPKSEWCSVPWFGFKYLVTPESSKLLQETVFTLGGSWCDGSREFKVLKYDSYWVYVAGDGVMSWSIITNANGLPEKQPPQPAKVEPNKKDFIVGKWVVPKGFAGCVFSSSVDNFKPNDFSITREDVNMSIQRKVVEVQLFDDAKGLPVQDSLVAKFENVLTEDDNDTTIREVIMNNDIKKVLVAHNMKRAKVINQDILERTGNSVALQPVLLKDLRWKVIG